jgi:Kef-type K+ transport system membrane component KefB
MPNVSFSGLLIVTIVAFLAPLLLAISPARRLSSIVLEIVAGILIGPSVLGWVKLDLPISILSVLGLAFLLFLSGLEVDLQRLRGRLLRYVGLAFLASSGLALLVGYGLYAAGQVMSPLLIAIILVATALGVVVPVLEDAGESSTDFGQLAIAGATFAEFGSIILLSLFFSREATGPATKLVMLGGFALLAAGFVFVLLRLERSTRIAVLPLTVVDNSTITPIRLTVPSDAPYDQEAFSCSHFKRRGLYDLSCLLVLALSLPSPFSGAALASWLAPSSPFPLSSCIQAQPSLPSAQATHPA